MLKPLTTEEQLPPQVSLNRVLVIMAVIIAIGALAGFIFGTTRFGTGVLIGGVLSIANYYWQRSSTRAIFAQAANGEKPMLLSVRYILRYVAIGLVVWMIYATEAFPIVAVVLGLAAFAFAVVIEGLIGIFSSFKR